MTITATALAALQESVQKAAAILTLALPSDAGGTMLLSNVDAAVNGSGFYEGKIRDGGWGQIRYATSDREGNLQAVETTVSVDDTGTRDQPVGPLGRAFKLADCQGSTATISLAIDGVPVADYPVLFTGKLDRYERDGETGWKLYLRVDDSPLRRPAVRIKITSSDWPAAHQDVLGKYAPLVLGTVSSVGLGEAGLRSALYVDTARWRYLLSLGTISSTGLTVYSAGVAKTITTDYTYYNTIVAGRTWTFVEFLADQGDNAVTFDCAGIDISGYGTSTNPTNQLRFFLENCVFRDWTGATRDIATATYTDATSFSSLATFLTSYEGAPALGVEASQGMEVLRGFCQSFSVPCWWTELGTLAVGPFDPFTTSIYPTDPVMFYGEHMTGPMSLMTSSDELVRAMTLRYLTGADGQPTQSITVVHPNYQTALAKDRIVTWGAGRVV